MMSSSRFNTTQGRHRRLKPTTSKAVIRLHVNKFEMKKGKSGRPWTVHTSKKCIPAKDVRLRTLKCATEYKPEKPSNPKAFVT